MPMPKARRRAGYSVRKFGVAGVVGEWRPSRQDQIYQGRKPVLRIPSKLDVGTPRVDGWSQECKSNWCGDSL